jgi:hypothetical protein
MAMITIDSSGWTMEPTEQQRRRYFILVYRCCRSGGHGPASAAAEAQRAVERRAVWPSPVAPIM